MLCIASGRACHCNTWLHLRFLLSLSVRSWFLVYFKIGKTFGFGNYKSSVRGEARGMDPVGREGRSGRTRHELLRKGDVDWFLDCRRAF
jgi:hypothetical protein